MQSARCARGRAQAAAHRLASRSPWPRNEMPPAYRRAQSSEAAARHCDRALVAPWHAHTATRCAPTILDADACTTVTDGA
ncbi:MAG: hypothetical protein WDW38_006470 [Sanguina aurantia]